MNPKSGNAPSPITPTTPQETIDADSGKPGKVTSAVEKVGDGDDAAASAEPHNPTEEEVEELSWIEIELVDEEGNPVPGEKYQIITPEDEKVASGSLDQNGFARVEGIKPGTCKVTFPKLDKDAWEPAQQAVYHLPPNQLALNNRGK